MAVSRSSDINQLALQAYLMQAMADSDPDPSLRALALDRFDFLTDQLWQHGAWPAVVRLLRSDQFGSFRANVDWAELQGDLRARFALAWRTFKPRDPACAGFCAWWRVVAVHELVALSRKDRQTRLLLDFLPDTAGDEERDSLDHWSAAYVAEHREWSWEDRVHEVWNDFVAAYLAAGTAHSVDRRRCQLLWYQLHILEGIEQAELASTGNVSAATVCRAIKAVKAQAELYFRVHLLKGIAA